MPEEIMKGIWTFPIVLPNNPLKCLNCYVILGDGKNRNLLIDTGFNMPACREALLEGVQALGMDLRQTDVFLTHLHADHTGNAAALHEMGCRLMMPRLDYQVHLNGGTGRWKGQKARAAQEGMPPEVIVRIFAQNPAVIYASPDYPVSLLDDGDRLSYGGYALTCISTPGHTPGHMCLYAPEEKLMFLGDHVLFDITPNICNWVEMDDALGTYLQSLRAIQTYDVRVPLPAHRSMGDADVRARANALLEHHANRLDEAEQIILQAPGATAYEIAGKMSWKIRADSWEEFPPGQKWFAFGETLAHLDHLVRTGRIARGTANGHTVYLPGSKAKPFCAHAG